MVDPETKNLQTELKKLAIKFNQETFFKLAAMAGITGTELPDKMEKINQIMENEQCNRLAGPMYKNRIFDKIVSNRFLYFKSNANLKIRDSFRKDNQSADA
jgi:hypothetical protein